MAEDEQEEETEDGEDFAEGLQEAFEALQQEYELLEDANFRNFESMEDSPVTSIKLSEPETEGLKFVCNAQLERNNDYYVTGGLMLFGPEDEDDIAHQQLTLKVSPSRDLAPGWDMENPDQMIELEDEEVARLAAFLENFEEIIGNEDEEWVVAPAERSLKENVESVIESVSSGPTDPAAIQPFVEALSTEEELVEQLSKRTSDEVSRSISSGLRLSRRRKAILELRGLIQLGEDDEDEFKDLFKDHWWMLGARYIDLIPRDDFTPDDELDLALVRADGFAEIVELKRPDADLFKEVRDEPAVNAEVNDAVNQATNYISQLENRLPLIRDQYGVDFYKVRGKVVVGTFDEEEEDWSLEEQKEALRRYNNHLHRIEVLTYDQVIWRAQEQVRLDREVMETDGEEQ